MEEKHYYVYTITGSGLTYYGSSGYPICERKSKHKTEYKHWKETRNGYKTQSYEILDLCDNWEFNVLEDGYTKQEALDREKWFIQNKECVNKNLPYLTEEEKREYKRKWAETNRRENGIMPKTKMSEEEVREKARIRKANRIANMTAEEKEKYLEKQRSYAKPLSEEKRLEAIERTRLWRETKMTEEQKQAKNEKAKIRQANIRANLTEEEKVIRNEEAKTRMATKYANMTQEEKDEINRKRRENRKPLTEEQKQKQREVSLRHYHKNK